MEVLDLKVGMQNEDFQMQNEEQQNSPKIKKIRKLVRKSKKQTSSDEDNNNIFQEEDVEIKKNNINSDLNDIDNNMFENKLLIQEDNNDKQPTYKSKLDELSEQIAQMDAEKQQKKQRKLNKKKNFSEDNEYQYFDDDEEKKMAEKQEKKKQKKQKEKIELEKNEDMIKRLADKFNDEEEDIEDYQQNQKDNDDDEDYEDETGQDKRKRKSTKGGTSKQNQNAAIIKTNNKLFKEINTLESANLDNIEEQPVEEECLLEESIKFERQNNKNQKNLFGFLKQSMIYKKQRGIECENSQNMLKESTNMLEKSQSFNASKQISVNQEEQKEQLEQSQNIQNLSQKSSNGQQETQLKSGASAIQNSDDSQKFIDFSNIQRQISSSSIAPNSQDKKLQLLKQTSQKITKKFSFSQSQNLSQGLNKFSQSQDDDLEFELQVPTIDQSQKHQQIINNTLFLNKIIRTNNQNVLLKQQSSINSASSNSQNVGQTSSQLQEKAKLLSRNEFLKQSQKRLTERKSQNIDLKTFQNTFKQTTFDHLLEQNEKKQKKNQNSQENEDGEKQKTETKKSEDNDNDSQNTENDSDYDPNKNSEESDAEEEANKGEKPDEQEGDKQRQLIEAEIQYRKLLALEEGIDEKEFERQIRLEYGLETEKDENLEVDNQDQENDDQEESMSQNDDKQDEDNQEQQVQNLDDQLVAFEEDAEQSNQNKIKDDSENEIKPMRRLKNIAAEILKKQQEKKEKERIRQQKEERRKQLLNNPIMKKIMNEMIDDEAELGSDNEENDDKIKQIGDEDEYKEAGLSKEEDLDAELKELINNVVEFNEENEQLATSKFIRDLAKRDKEEIKKIIEGAYKGTRAKRRNLSDLLVEEGDTSESKKLKRIQDAIRTLQEQTGENQYSDDEDGNESEGDFDPITGNQNINKSKSKKDHNEKEQIQIREANLLLKKEFQKASQQNKFDEKNLVDSSILDLISNKQAATTSASKVAVANGATNQKKIIPTKISEKVGVLKGNLSFGNGQPSLAQQLVNQQQQNQQNIQGFSNLRGANLKNSILHVKNNKNRYSQFNDSFNKESMINEFGESALTKAFQNYADHSQNIFYSKQNNEDSNSRPLDKANKLNKKNSSNQSLQGSSSQNFKNVSSINKLFKSNSISAAQISSNSFAQQFGKKKFSTTSNDSKN
ncbi:hypothetical protein ABPG74_004158 [Tetrahymena malaccensis]